MEESVISDYAERSRFLAFIEAGFLFLGVPRNQITECALHATRTNFLGFGWLLRLVMGR